MFDIDLDIELGNTEEELKDDPGKRRLLLFYFIFSLFFAEIAAGF